MKYLNVAKKYGARVGSGAAIMAASTGAALAQSAYDPLTSAVDWSDVGTAIITVLAAIVGVYVLFKGGKLVVRAVKGA